MALEFALLAQLGQVHATRRRRLCCGRATSKKSAPPEARAGFPAPPPPGHEGTMLSRCWSCVEAAEGSWGRLLGGAEATGRGREGRRREAGRRQRGERMEGVVAGRATGRISE